MKIVVKRKSLILYYENYDALIKLLDNQNVNITYNSIKNKYLVIYFDKDRLEGLKNYLSKQKCILEIVESEVEMDQFAF